MIKVKEYKFVYLFDGV